MADSVELADNFGKSLFDTSSGIVEERCKRVLPSICSKAEKACEKAAARGCLSAEVEVNVQGYDQGYDGSSPLGEVYDVVMLRELRPIFSKRDVEVRVSHLHRFRHRGGCLPWLFSREAWFGRRDTMHLQFSWGDCHYDYDGYDVDGHGELQLQGVYMKDPDEASVEEVSLRSSAKEDPVSS